MSDLHKAAAAALEALEGVLDTYGEPLDLLSISGGAYEALQCRDAITALRAALAEPVPIIESEITADKREPVQEPLAWMDREGDLYKMPEIEGWAPPHTMLYAASHQRKPLTDDEIEALADEVPIDEMTLSPSTWHLKLARAIERAHGIGSEA